MIRSATSDALPEHLRSTFQMIRSAFPRGIETESYLPLLALLGQNMADRNLAEAVASSFDIDVAQVLNDIYRARSAAVPTPESLDEVRQRLVVHGYEKWLQEE